MRVTLEESQLPIGWLKGRDGGRIVTEVRLTVSNDPSDNQSHAGHRHPVPDHATGRSPPQARKVKMWHTKRRSKGRMRRETLRRGQLGGVRHLDSAHDQTVDVLVVRVKSGSSSLQARIMCAGFCPKSYIAPRPGLSLL